ncbi:hypothetical protein OIO90_004444 [Microbotryomycetes sp. JL221]|nr:hypothetical protein OIO90_004444 [Microbotryomycetes sp. JL221]
MGVVQDTLLALTGDYGTAGLYGSLQRVFGMTSLLALPLCLIINAPFGKWSPTSSWLTVNGNLGWFVMELVAPLSFISSAMSPVTTIRSSTWPTWSIWRQSSTPWLELFPHLTFQRFNQMWQSLPLARRVLFILFITHYINRSIISSIRNPNRQRMSLLVPLFAILFNFSNGTLMGKFIEGGFTNLQDTRHQKDTWGIIPSTTSSLLGFEFDNKVVLFWFGIVLWFVGFLSNIVCDEMLYNLKKQHQPSSSLSKTNDNKQQHGRYKIPRGFLYEYVSHPSYFVEWIEWTGYLIACLCLQPSPFETTLLTPSMFKQLLNSHLKISAQKGLTLKLLRGLPKHLKILTSWFLKPPSLFLWAEISAMLPRAIRGHEWYQETFKQDWPKNRKIVIPFLF